MGIEDEIREIEEEIAETPYNKSTEEHIGRLKAKLSRLKEEREKRAGSSGGGEGYAPKKTGDATVVLVGYPSVGKSTLLNSLTNAASEVGSYAFTTLQVVPGMVEIKGAKVQLLDVPGLIGGASSGRGRGGEVLGVVRSADLALLIGDAREPGQVDELREELHDVGVRLDREPPDVRLETRDRGGLEVRSTADLALDESTIRTVLGERGFLNGRVTIREDLDVDRFIDAISEDRVYMPSMETFNKADLAEEEDLRSVYRRFDDPLLISAETGQGLDELRSRIYESLDLIRVLLKPRSGEPDRDDPLILRKGSTVGDAAKRIHRDLAEGFRWARVWGPSAKHEGQQVGVDHELCDGDALTIVD